VLDDSLFRKVDGALKATDEDFAAASEHYGAKFSDSFEAFFRKHHSSYLVHQTFGFEGLECVGVNSPQMMRKYDSERLDWWGPEFAPFMYSSYARFAFDLRERKEDPPVVFLDGEHRSDYDEPVNYNAVTPLTENFDEFAGLISVWRRPDGLPLFSTSGRSEALSELGDVRFSLLQTVGSFVGWTVRSGVVGSHGLTIPYHVGYFVPNGEKQREQMHELHVDKVHKRFVPVIGERFIPFMTGENGWLAMDFRETLEHPPIVYLERAGDVPSGRIERVADTPLEALKLYV